MKREKKCVQKQPALTASGGVIGVRRARRVVACRGLSLPSDSGIQGGTLRFRAENTSRFFCRLRLDTAFAQAHKLAGQAQPNARTVFTGGGQGNEEAVRQPAPASGYWPATAKPGLSGNRWRAILGGERTSWQRPAAVKQLLHVDDGQRRSAQTDFI